jgi:CubicO group peptidase (beta-lactamase class C family)
MAQFAARAKLAAAPGARWTYTNGDTILLSSIIRDRAGGDAIDFAERELFEPLGMSDVTFETDQVGTPIGASHLWASARDWARFGLLYLNDGVVAGRRILPQGWSDYSAKLTPQSQAFGYGAGFWTNRGDGAGPRRRVAGGMPSDSYMARGNQGQYLVIVPSAHLIVLRMGMAYTPGEDVDVVARLVGETLAALRSAQPSAGRSNLRGAASSPTGAPRRLYALTATKPDLGK